MLGQDETRSFNQVPPRVAGAQVFGLFSTAFLDALEGSCIRSTTARTTVDTHIGCQYCRWWLNFPYHMPDPAFTFWDGPKDGQPQAKKQTSFLASHYARRHSYILLECLFVKTSLLFRVKTNIKIITENRFVGRHLA